MELNGTLTSTLIKDITKTSSSKQQQQQKQPELLNTYNCSVVTFSFNI